MRPAPPFVAGEPPCSKVFKAIARMMTPHSLRRVGAMAAPALPHQSGAYASLRDGEVPLELSD